MIYTISKPGQILPVRNNYHSSPCKESHKFISKTLFSLRVKVSGWFIEDEYRSITEQGTGYGKPLFLTSGKFPPRSPTMRSYPSGNIIISS